MKHTTNLALNLPDRTDKFSITHANDNMTAIDTKFKQTDTKFTEVQASTTTQIATAKNQQTALLNSELSRLRKQQEIEGINRFLVDYNTFLGISKDPFGTIFESFLNADNFTSMGNLSFRRPGASIGSPPSPAISVNFSFPFRFKRVYFYIYYKIDPDFSITCSLSHNNGSTWQVPSKLRELTIKEPQDKVHMYKLELPQYSSTIRVKLEAYVTSGIYQRIHAYGVYFDDLE